MPDPESEITETIRDLVARLKQGGHSDVAIVAVLTEAIEEASWAHQPSDEWVNALREARGKILSGGSGSLLANCA
jgi:hypothetical protein